MERRGELTKIIQKDERLMEILQIARSVNLPNWYVGAGVVRNAVWDNLHGNTEKTPIRDIDLIYFSSEPIDEEAVRQQLTSALPEVEWDFKNSLNVHEWYKNKKGIERTALMSSEQDIDNWPEVCSCIGVRLQDDDQLLIYAPYGIDDLMDIVFRRNAAGEGITKEIFEWRVVHKEIQEKWPKVKVVWGS